MRIVASSKGMTSVWTFMACLLAVGAVVLGLMAPAALVGVILVVVAAAAGSLLALGDSVLLLFRSEGGEGSEE